MFNKDFVNDFENSVAACSSKVRCWEKCFVWNTFSSEKVSIYEILLTPYTRVYIVPYIIIIIIIIIIFILFYIFGCQVSFLLFMYKICSFFPISHFLTCLIPRNLFSFKMAAFEFSHVFLGRPHSPFPVILACRTFFMGLLSFILIRWPNHLSCCLCIFFYIS